MFKNLCCNKRVAAALSLLTISYSTSDRIGIEAPGHFYAYCTCRLARLIWHVKRKKTLFECIIVSDQLLLEIHELHIVIYDVKLIFKYKHLLKLFVYYIFTIISASFFFSNQPMINVYNTMMNIVRFVSEQYRFVRHEKQLRRWKYNRKERFYRKFLHWFLQKQLYTYNCGLIGIESCCSG